MIETRTTKFTLSYKRDRLREAANCAAGSPDDLLPVEIWATRLGDGRWVDSDAPDLLSAQEMARAAQFRFALDRWRWVAGRCVVRTLLGSVLSIEPDQVRFVAGPTGKPYLEAPHHHLRFSVAHTEDLLLLAVAERHDVGVDAEYIRRVPEANAIARNLFSETTTREIEGNVDQDERASAFIRAWVRLEALGKATGQGLVPLGELQNAERWTVTDFRLPGGFHAAVALERDTWTIATRFVSVDHQG